MHMAKGIYTEAAGMSFIGKSCFQYYYFNNVLEICSCCVFMMCVCECIVQHMGGNVSM